MSPAASRRYRVSFIDWELHETVVLATGKREAIAKAAAMYQLNGLAEFTTSAEHAIDWNAELIGEGASS
ncbi:hypothetical protein ABIA85_005911 [Bradyrhizobium sp. LA6.10]|uniref:hypothetical protein n=1 Tax=Bradyrhizobium sp. LA6.10 TaxID=3156318 RepID=UPI003397B5CE